MLSALFGGFTLQNASDSEDSTVMKRALGTNKGSVQIGHAGTAMRFLTAYFSGLPGAEVILDGSARMRERPVSILVEALRESGADIEYMARQGFAPLKIRGKALRGGLVTVDASVSSQYLSALIMMGPKMKNGLHLTYSGQLTSAPYVEMTLHMLRKIGVRATHNPGNISVSPLAERFGPFREPVAIAPDWSSASYFYSCMALSKAGTTMRLLHFSADDLQGDRAVVGLFEPLGVQTTFYKGGIVLLKTDVDLPKCYAKNLADTPDLAQTIAVCCLGLGIGVSLTGLHTLAIKETDRLAALQTEMQKLGAGVTIGRDVLRLDALSGLRSGVYIDTYQDHRMAMAFAPLALRVPISIREPGVVKKSFSDFWAKLTQIGFTIAFE